MLEKVSPLYAFWTVILHCCDKSATLQVFSPVQTFVGWNASINMQLDPYPGYDSMITVWKNGMIIMRVKGTQSRDVADRFEFTGNTIENRISFVLRNVTLGDAGTYTATEFGLSPRGEQILIVKDTSPIQTFVGWNASFNMQLDPYPANDSLITVMRNGTLIMHLKGTQSRDVADRFEFTGNTIENRISFVLRNVTLGDAGIYTATESGFSPGGEQILIVKASPSKPQIIALTGSAALGSDYRLNCSSVSNSAPPDHGLIMMSEWKVNDQLITTGIHYNVQGTELTINSISRQDNNIKLTCVTYEDSLAKSVPSNEHVIDVKYGPDNVQLNPSGGIIKAIENHSVIIQCTADCNPTCSFQWRRGSVPGYLKPNHTLIIDSIGKSDTDNYTCTVFNSITGRSQSLQTTLVAIYGPSSGQVMLSTSQSIIIVEDGTMLNITCSADCYPPCSFTWTGPHGFSQSGAQLSQFVDRNKEGNYICTASNQENLWKSATASVTVIVMYGPGSSVNLGSNPPTSVNLHQRTPDITCSATCNPPCDYRWYHDRTMYSSGATLSLGVIENKTSGGNYTCEAYNKFLGLDRSSSTSVNITIYYGAEIVSLSVLDSNTVNEKSSAIFQCQVDSNPLPTITWKKEGTDTVLKTESGVVQSQFRIESARCQDTDNYTCSAYNGIWTQANGTLQFFVKCHPRTDSEVPLERKVYKKVHEAAFLRYMVISYPLPKFTWTFLGNGSESRNLPDSASLYVNGRQSELLFTSLNTDDFGYYSVVADNSLPPSAREVFEIIPPELPSPVIHDPQVAAVSGGVVGGILFVIVIVVVAVILKRWTLKPKKEENMMRVVFDDKGPEHVNVAFKSDVNTTEYEALQSDQTGISHYEALNDLTSKLDPSTDNRISCDPRPSTSEMLYDKLQPCHTSNQDHMYSSLSSPGLDEDENKFYANTVIVNQILA